mmetsp:Transcript_54834/g.138545  ORF Transcript_54834/g.138545 Transcript_54834/m.138545 type:complete len:228 (-) Transcript_54834:80-763(-)
MLRLLLLLSPEMSTIGGMSRNEGMSVLRSEVHVCRALPSTRSLVPGLSRSLPATGVPKLCFLGRPSKLGAPNPSCRGKSARNRTAALTAASRRGMPPSHRLPKQGEEGAAATAAKQGDFAITQASTTFASDEPATEPFKLSCIVTGAFLQAPPPPGPSAVAPSKSTMPSEATSAAPTMASSLHETKLSPQHRVRNAAPIKAEAERASGRGIHQGTAFTKCRPANSLQ